MEPTPERFAAGRLRAFAAAVLERQGVPPEDAALAAEVLVAADLRGLDAHGVARLADYAAMLAAGRVNPRPAPRVVRETATTATLDGDNGLGLVVGPRANELAMARAEAFGSGWVAVRGSNHFGMAAYYPLRALGRGLIGWAMTNTPAQVAVPGARGRMLGTNPVAAAFPGREEPPVVIDMAASVVSFGRVEQARRRGELLPEGAVVDRDGLPTRDPAEVLEAGALLPLGSDAEHGVHKGYCLAALVDLMTGVMGGAGWGPYVPIFPLGLPEPARVVGPGTGHLFGALRIDGFDDPDAFRARVDDWVRTMRAAAPAPGSAGPRVPGDPEREAEQDRQAHGIPLIPSVLQRLRALAYDCGVAFD